MPAEEILNTILALASDEYITPGQAAKELRVTRQTIYNYLNDPNHPLPAIKAGGWKIRRGDLAAYIQAKHSRETVRTQEPQTPILESDQMLREQLGEVIEIARLALEWKRAGQVLSASGVSFDPEFIERCSNDLIVKSGALTKQLGSINDQTLSALRFALSSITSSLPLSGKTENE